MSKITGALPVKGFCLELTSSDGRATFFYPSARHSGSALRDLAVWMVENGFMLDSDGSPMVMAG